MRQRNVKDQDEVISKCEKYIEQPENIKGNWKNKYSKFKEIRLEIGIGKAQFIYNMAKSNPDVLFVGIELNKGVIALATKKIARMEKEDDINLTNLALFDYNAAELMNVFDKGEVDKIYLNFSDPWPKKRHAKRRLTSASFLNVYKNILRESGEIEFKTDNRGLFEYSLVSFCEARMNLLFISCNLHRDVELKKVEGNIETEYEEKFSKNGPIYKCIVKF